MTPPVRLLLPESFSLGDGRRELEGDAELLMVNGVLGVGGWSGEWFSSLMGVLARVERGVREERGETKCSMERERVTGPVSRSEGRMKRLMAG